MGDCEILFAVALPATVAVAITGATLQPSALWR
jgi:hypothetical protein